MRFDVLRRTSENPDEYKYIFEEILNRKLLLTLNLYNLVILWFKEEKKERRYAP